MIAAALGPLLALTGCGEKDEPTSFPPPPTTAPQGGEPPTQTGGDAGSGSSPAERRIRAVERTVERYVEGLDRGDGAAVCAVLAPGALADVELPRGSGGCAPSLEASIGYADPRGLPVFESAELAGFVSTEVESRSARSTATIVTEFSDRAEPSIEDDIVYLEGRGERWLIAKASSVLYRAVGIADVPPQVLAPPR